MPKQINSNLHSLIAAAAVAPAEGSSDGAWMRVMPAGTVTLRDGRGPYQVGDVAAMLAIVKRTLDQAGETDVMVDYDHQAFFGSVPGVGGQAKAAGWVKEFDVREDGIYARVEWTEAAAAAIRAKEYRYLSPLFGADKKSGRVTAIRNVGLVNIPAMDLAAVAARADETFNQDETMKEIAKLLGLAEDAGEEKILAHIKTAQESQGKAMTAAGLKADAGLDKLVETVAAMADERKKLAEAVGCKADAKGEELIAAAKKTAEAGEPDPTKWVPASTMKAVQDDLTAIKSERAAEKAEEAVEAAIKDGRLIPAQRDWAMKTAKADLAGFNEFVGGAPKLTTAQLGSERKAAGEAKIDDNDRAIAAALGLSEDAMVAARKLEN